MMEVVVLVVSVCFLAILLSDPDSHALLCFDLMVEERRRKREGDEGGKRDVGASRTFPRVDPSRTGISGSWIPSSF